MEGVTFFLLKKLSSGGDDEVRDSDERDHGDEPFDAEGGQKHHAESGDQDE